MADLESEINSVIQQSGIDYPSDYFNRWLAQIYPEGPILNGILDVFGCANGANGEVVDCQDKLDRYMTAATFGCNSRHSFQGNALREGLENGSLGPLYPMEFRIRNCDPNGQKGYQI